MDPDLTDVPGWRSADERAEIGRLARKRAPRSVHREWQPHADRHPIETLEAQNARREPDLVPIRHGRMLVSPFTFYRGAAAVMAGDLQRIPNAGLIAQACGDAHLSNFGLFASPERTLLFGLNDFDETLPGPFEYDLVRLATSIVIAGRDNGLSPASCRSAARAAMSQYRVAMHRFAAMSTFDVWYARTDADEVVQHLAGSRSDELRVHHGVAEKTLRKARTRGSLQALDKLTEVVDGHRRIVSDPPTLVPARELGSVGYHDENVEEVLRDQFAAYRATLPDDRRVLLERFEVVDFARKVVGVGSVGTRAWIVLLIGRDEGDPLFLQVKEATASVLENHLPPSIYATPGERVVQGQRLMQAASDIMLGWTQRVETGRSYYWRQLRDMKGSARIERMDRTALAWYAGGCGAALARAHARSGDPIAIASYLGSSDRFDRSMIGFCERYADQNERDHASFAQAVRDGRLDAVEGV